MIGVNKIVVAFRFFFLMGIDGTDTMKCDE